MIIIKGKYNSANVMIDTIDDETRKQIQGFVNNPSFSENYIAVMSDCHAGKGSCVGFTMKLGDRVIPEVIGVDIGCGMLSCKFDIDNIDVAAFDTFIREEIPSGFSINKKAYSLKSYFEFELKKTVKRIGIDEDRVFRSLGTLGGGNHFIEIGKDEKENIWITIHSGSRNFGLQIAKHYTEKAKELCTKWGSDTQGIPFLLTSSSEGHDYLLDQDLGVEYAKLNREFMMRKIISFVGKDPSEIILSTHNYIDKDNMIRKGAISAKEGEKLVIPFNMKDGLAICTGKGSKKFNYSAPHGAGRILSRSKAKATLSLEQFQQEMKDANIYTTSVCRGTLDEAPGAYKDMNIILENIKETVDVVSMVKPIYNFKEGGE